MKFIKGFFRGLLYLILSPIILACFAIYMVYCAILFICMFFVNLFKFFTGRKLLGTLKEDIQAQEIILNANKKEEANQNTTSTQTIQQSQPASEVKQQIINNYIFTNPKDLQNLNLNPNTNQIETSNPVAIETKPINQIEQKNDYNVVTIESQENQQVQSNQTDEVDKEISDELKKTLIATNQNDISGNANNNQNNNEDNQ